MKSKKHHGAIGVRIRLENACFGEYDKKAEDKNKYEARRNLIELHGA